MDTFIEQLVAKRSTAKDTIFRILIVLGVLVVAVISYFLSILTPLPMIGMLVLVGGCYGAYFLMTSLNVEYEYIVTNGELDIDKIIARRKRKRLLTVSAKTFEEFGPYTENTSFEAAQTTVEATDASGQGIYYAVFRHPAHGQTSLFFTPDERVLEAIKIALPRNIRTR